MKSKDGFSEFGLTEKEQAVADVYLADPHHIKYKAYLAIYPTTTPDNARSSAAKLFKKPHVREYITSMKREMYAQKDVTTGEVLSGIRRAGELAEDNGDYAVMLNAFKLLGQSIMMFKSETAQAIDSMVDLMQEIGSMHKEEGRQVSVELPRLERS